MVDETIFVDSDNEVNLILIDPTDLSDPLYPNGKPYDFISQGVTLMELFVGCEKFTSTDGDIVYADEGVIRIKLGSDTTLVHDIYFSSSIKIYDPSHVNGQFIVNNNFKNAKLNLIIIDPSTC